MIVLKSNAKKHIVSKEQNAISFSEGDEIALAFFYDEFYLALSFYACKIVQNRSLAEDIVSGAFIKTWRFHYKLNSNSGIKAYLYKVVHRDSIEALKAAQKRTEFNDAIPTTIFTESPFDIMVKTEVYRKLYTALKHLSPATQRVMIMHYFQGKSTGQIARELMLHPSTIKTYLVRFLLCRKLPHAKHGNRAKCSGGAVTIPGRDGAHTSIREFYGHGGTNTFKLFHLNFSGVFVRSNRNN